MKRKYQIIGLIILIICSIVYDFQMPSVKDKQEKVYSYVILEGEFLKNGKYEYEGEKYVSDLVKEVGVSKQANLKALSLDMLVEDESRLYLPAQNEKVISLNQASKEMLMSLKGVGEKTAQKIIDYRKVQPFLKIEDIMKVSGIGEKTYLRLREFLCL